MIHLPHLIQDLAFILMTAAVVTLLFKKLKQPVVLGYLSAGLLLGPKFAFFPNIKDTSGISIWAEIGVIFMLFGLGLEFSFKKLTTVGKSASITASLEIIFMLAVGFVVGQLMGWSTMDSLFLGGMISISSTTIIVRAFEELGLKGKNFVALVFGVLIVEDLIAILLLVLLSSVAATQSLSGSELLMSSLKLGFFLVLWFVLGIYLLPVFFRKIRNLLSNETTLVVSIGLCLMMVYIATEVGFSPALGAFVMGSLLAETQEGHRIESLLMPVKDLFSAIFFVSVGMLIDPSVLVEYWGVILVLTLVTVVGKLLSSTAGALLSGRSLKHSVQAGMSLAQIGEFSFIIATLGITLNVTSNFLYPIAVAVSAITTFITPYLIQSSDGFYQWIDRRLPTPIKLSLSRYEALMESKSESTSSAANFKAVAARVGLNAIIVIAIIKLPYAKLNAGLGEATLNNMIALVIASVIALPFLWAVFLGGDSDVSPSEKKRMLAASVFRYVLGLSLLGALLGRFIDVLSPEGLVLFAVILTTVLVSRKLSEPIYRKIELRFLNNLTEKERMRAIENSNPALAPWNAILSEFTISPESNLIGKPLFESKLKERFGVTVAMIERGKRKIVAPGSTDLILPFDKLFLIGDEHSTALAGKELHPEVGGESSREVKADVGLASLTLKLNDAFVHQTIQTSGMREAVDGLIVGVERAGVRYLSPEASMELLPDDLIWIVGDLEKIKARARSS